MRGVTGKESGHTMGSGAGHTRGEGNKTGHTMALTDLDLSDNRTTTVRRYGEQQVEEGYQTPRS